VICGKYGHPVSSQQILNLEKEGFTVDEIVEDLGYARENVELILSNHKPDLPLSEKFSELEDTALAVVRSALHVGTADNAALKAAFYVLDQRQGLKQPIGKTEVNIADFNVRLEKAREVMKKAIEA
jgi:hypothetical protein